MEREGVRRSKTQRGAAADAFDAGRCDSAGDRTLNQLQTKEEAVVRLEHTAAPLLLSALLFTLMLKAGVRPSDVRALRYDQVERAKDQAFVAPDRASVPLPDA